MTETSPPRPPRPARPPRPMVTIALVALNLLGFAIALARGADPLEPSTDQVLALGGNAAWLTLHGQPWRLLTSLFLHYGVIHLAMNMLGLVSGGLLVERLVGRAGFAAIYLLAGLTGSLATIALDANAVAAGASGAIVGVFGAIGAWLVAQRDRVDAGPLHRHARGLLMFLAFSLLFGASVKSIGLSAHVGGLVAGFVVGLALTWGEADRRRARLAVVTALGLAGVGVGLVMVPTPSTAPPASYPAAFDDYRRVEAPSIDAVNAMMAAVRAGTLTAGDFADRLEQRVLPSWQAVRQRLATGPAPTARYRDLDAALIGYVDARIAAWTALTAALRGHGPAATELDALGADADEAFGRLTAEIAKLR